MDSCCSYHILKDKFKTFLKSVEGWQNLPVTAGPLTTVQAIGRPETSDYPLLRGKEVLLEAVVLDGRGQAFTNAPVTFAGTLEEVLDFNLDDNSQRAIFIATVNAALNHLGVATATVHCRDSEPDRCGPEMARKIKEKYGLVPVGIIGYQPSIISGCVQELGTELIRVTAMDTYNLGMSRFGIEIWDGVTKTDELIAKSDILLITGTTFVNGTAFELLSKAAGKPVYFYGTTVAGAAALMGYQRLCFYGKA